MFLVQPSGMLFEGSISYLEEDKVTYVKKDVSFVCLIFKHSGPVMVKCEYIHAPAMYVWHKMMQTVASNDPINIDMGN